MQYCIFNQQYSKEEYQKKSGDINLCNVSQMCQIQSTFKDLKHKTPNKYYI
ncbi:hypothetical protein KKH82_04675 [Patescibacteria group bacterium]|nr:hypothetical protein [Patescibacteria group bacterium]